jgi:hypothetical protein
MTYDAAVIVGSLRRDSRMPTSLGSGASPLRM